MSIETPKRGTEGRYDNGVAEVFEALADVDIPDPDALVHVRDDG